MNKEIVKIIAKKTGVLVLYNMARRWCDDVFCDRFECGIGDILLLRDVPSQNQLLLTSRLMDVEDYLSGKDKSFLWQNTISYKAYGEKHREEDGNRSFRALIESYLKDGYHKDSFVTCDKKMNLFDGNHRMGLHIHEGIENVNVRRIHRIINFEYGGDWYYRVCLDTTFMNSIYKRFEGIQSWLIESGNTFCVKVKASGVVLNNIESDMTHLCKVLRVFRTEDGSIIQFAMNEPNYAVVNGKLVSLRAQRIASIMNKRWGENAEIVVSDNCMEGKILFLKRR